MTTPVLANTYKRLPITLTHGEGVWVWDSEKKRYLDALCGIAVTGLGHNYPAVTKAIQEQAARILHTSNLFQIEQQTVLANHLRRLTGLSQTFFCNSGTEAIETALKLARLHGHQRNLAVPKVLVFDGGFHGRSIAAVSAGSNPKYQAGFEPLLPGFIRVPFNNLGAIKDAAKKHPDIVAVLLEPVQGESGIKVADDNYLADVRTVCDQNNWMMILDEVQTGMGRTGSLFCYQQAKILPDVITLAKGLANGIPIGACVMGEKYAALFTPGAHGSTFGGNPLSCAAGIATVEEMERLQIWKNAEVQGSWLLDVFRKELRGNRHVKEIRGKGLMIGIELDRPCRDILIDGLRKGILFNIANETVVRLLPPLIISREQTQFLAKGMIELINTFTAG